MTKYEEKVCLELAVTFFESGNERLEVLHFRLPHTEDPLAIFDRVTKKLNLQGEISNIVTNVKVPGERHRMLQRKFPRMTIHAAWDFMGHHNYV